MVRLWWGIKFIVDVMNVQSLKKLTVFLMTALICIVSVRIKNVVTILSCLYIIAILSALQLKQQRI
ncbi:hypothetical protein A1Q5_08630 [Aliivibrio logei 5S-186]|uniref:Uncharacterized protein n=1 Tax=Aliivibrio logei 5S-186 TaxID=626086 RepID=A0ABX3AV52_ALILO|nr:hypothetical protein A1Q5_08630 [Aliivibrio logei 5S-186]